MNPIALIHIAAGLAVAAVSWPLIRRSIPMNALYGVRIKESFASAQRWYDINAYGGRVLRRWGIAISVMGVVGLLLPREHWLAYAWSSLAVVLGGLAITVAAIYRYARVSRTADRERQ